MNDRRRLFLETAEVTRTALSRPEVAAAWETPSALESFSIRGLAGHLLRGAGSVLVYLDRDEPGGTPISAAVYYAEAVTDPEQTGSDPVLDSALHRAIRQRGEEAAAGGHAALAAEATRTIGELRRRLADEPPGRLVRVFKDLVLSLDDYLATRIVELVVHLDDLNVSLGLEERPPPAALEVTIATLVDVARAKHGDVAVVRALARRERDKLKALRVL